MAKANVNAYWDYVTSKYPDAIFDFWYSIGELHFYPDKKTKDMDSGLGEKVWSCYKECGKFIISHEF